MKRIYLDNAATTQLNPRVLEAMNESFSYFGNPSSLHTFGQEARKLIDEAHDFVAFFLDCKPTEVVFTSGGSESNNLAIKGIVEASQQVSKSAHQQLETGSQIESGMTNREHGITKKILPHIITSAIGHHAVLHTVQDLEKEGKIEATYIKPDKNGIIRALDVEAAIRQNTILVSIMYVNNEVGTVQPIREIGKMIEAKNKQRAKIYFHTDAVQAAEFFEMGTKYLHVDLLTLTAHKIHGPKGVGVLFVKKGTPIAPQITGGDQEFRLRAGTENVTSIVGLKTAIEEITNPKLQKTNKNQNSKDQNITKCHSVIDSEVSDLIAQTRREFSSESQGDGILKQVQDDKVIVRDDNGAIHNDNYLRVKKLRDGLENSILKTIPETYLNGDREKRSPAISNISFKNAEGEAIILNLDFLGIAVSSGSACTTRSLEPSHVLTAMGVPHELSHGAIRFSLSRETTEEEIDRVIAVLPPIIKKLREMSPFQ